MTSQISHQIKGRTKASDVFYTPDPLIKTHLEIVKRVWDGLTHNYPPIILDPCSGVAPEGLGYERGLVNMTQWYESIASYDIMDYEDAIMDEYGVVHNIPAKNGTAFDFLNPSEKNFPHGEPPLLTQSFDIICSNPPYSVVDKWLAQTVKHNPIIISYVLAVHALTPRRLEQMNIAGYFLEDMTICKVFKWYGMTALCTWVKYIPGLQGKGVNCIGYDRTLYGK